MPSSFSTMGLLLKYLWPKGHVDLKQRFVFSILVTVLAKAAGVLMPICYKKTVDLLATHPTDHLHLLYFFIVCYAMSRMFAIGFLELKHFFFTKVEQRAIRLISLEVFDHLHQLSLQYHVSRHTGSLTRTIERGSKAIETFLKFSSFNIVPTAIEIVITLIVVWVMYSYKVCLLMMVSILVYTLYSITITHWRAKYLYKMNEEDNTCHHYAMESLLNYETVKYFGSENAEHHRYNEAQMRYEQAAIKNKRGLAILNMGQGAITSFGFILVLIYVINRILADTLSLGSLVLINFYMIQVHQPLNILGFAYREIKQSLIDMHSMFKLLEVPIQVKDDDQASTLHVTQGDIRFENVSFGYDSKRLILDNISFHVPAGHKVAIVGRSGSGKTTIGRLLFRFYDPIKGIITIDEQNIKTVTQHSLRRSIGVVPQDMVLFNETLYYNIAYGNPEASSSEVHAAAKAAHLDSFIAKLPDQYETLVGERGLKLSGGEKQRVAIARTLLKKPKIYLFDEATSSLDSRTEKTIQKNLNTISKGHTTLIIAHRLSTITDADHIIVLDEGRIIEQGSHEQLLRQKSVYADMWARQAKEEKKETGK